MPLLKVGFAGAMGVRRQERHRQVDAPSLLPHYLPLVQVPSHSVGTRDGETQPRGGEGDRDSRHEGFVSLPRSVPSIIPWLTL